jgi:thiol-disulfide isomerase/thioredoxin
MTSACDKQPDNPPIPVGHWRAVATVPGGELPFGLELARDAAGWIAHAVNGEERFRFEEATVDGNRLSLRSPPFQSAIDVVYENGALAGTLTLTKRDGVQRIPFRAEHDAHHRFFPMLEKPEIRVDGRWAVTFTDDDGKSYPAVGEFRQEGAQVRGTFLTPTGDYRYLAGEVRGRELFLSCFDGSHLYLFKASLGEDGALAGDWWSGLKWHERWTARRDQNARLPDEDAQTYLKPGYDRFTFEFPDLDGKPVSLDDPRFAGKAVVVALFGSWCPNCHDEARFLAPLYKELRGQGLEIVGLAFELQDDFPTAARQVGEFRRKFGVEYTTLVAGVNDKADASQRLPALNAVLAFPTTIFIDRQGRVRRIHTGFSGPGTGEHYTRLTAAYRQTIEALLDESD